MKFRNTEIIADGTHTHFTKIYNHQNYVPAICYNIWVMHMHSTLAERMVTTKLYMSLPKWHSLCGGLKKDSFMACQLVYYNIYSSLVCVSFQMHCFLNAGIEEEQC